MSVRDNETGRQSEEERDDGMQERAREKQQLGHVPRFLLSSIVASLLAASIHLSHAPLPSLLQTMQNQQPPTQTHESPLS